MRLSALVLTLFVGTSVILLTIAGCAELLDRSNNSEPPPPTQKVRRDLLMEIEELKRKLAKTEQLLEQERKAKALQQNQTKHTLPPAASATSWQEATTHLPKHPVTGHVDWVAALEQDAIEPRPGLKSDAAEKAVFELNVTLNRNPANNTSLTQDKLAVTYPHAPHTQWLTCNNCHEKIFALAATKRPVITMAAIKDGQYCGVCHGKVAFDVRDACSRCHTGMPATPWQAPQPANPLEAADTYAQVEQHLPVKLGTADWVKALDEGLIQPRAGLAPDAQSAPVLPIDIERVPPGNPMFKVVFPHKAHTQWLTCNNCHTKIFKMQKGANPITMPKIFAGEYCGECHGKVAFPLQACGRCHAALAQGGGG